MLPSLASVILAAARRDTTPHWLSPSSTDTSEHGNHAIRICHDQWQYNVDHFKSNDRDRHADLRGDEFLTATPPSMLLINGGGHACGGSIRQALIHNSDTLDAINPGHQGWAQVQSHPVRRGVFNAAESVLIVLHDPIDRLISVYNTEAKSVNTKMIGRTKPGREPRQMDVGPWLREEYPDDELHACFPNVADFADGLDDDTPCGALARESIFSPKYRHVGMGSCYYIGGIIDALGIVPGRVHLVNAKTCDADIEAIPKWLRLTKWRSFGVGAGTVLPHSGDAVSLTGRARLLRHLAHEYALLARLQTFNTSRYVAKTATQSLRTAETRRNSSIKASVHWHRCLPHCRPNCLPYCR